MTLAIFGGKTFWGEREVNWGQIETGSELGAD
jgi:hypothetical protein